MPSPSTLDESAVESIVVLIAVPTVLACLAMPHVVKVAALISWHILLANR